jgi:hypothetical protein
MPTPKRIVIQYDGGLADQVVEFDAKPAVTPFAPGGVQTNAPAAPTIEMFSANPGQWDGMAQDMLKTAPPPRYYDETLPDDENPGQKGMYVNLLNLTPPTKGAWMKRDRAQFLRWWKETYKVDLNVSAFGPMQKKATGVTS